MARSLHHRGPDQDGFHFERGIGFASRRLSIVGIENGQQPVTNEDNSVIAVFNGEFFDHTEIRDSLVKKGHRFKTAADSEIIVHLWEEFGDNFLRSLERSICLLPVGSEKESSLPRSRSFRDRSASLVSG